MPKLCEEKSISIDSEAICFCVTCPCSLCYSNTFPGWLQQLLRVSPDVIGNHQSVLEKTLAEGCHGCSSTRGTVRKSQENPQWTAALH